MDQHRGSRVDLHIHSTASDGVLTPSEVVHLALEYGLETIALTDHDTLGGVEEAQRAADGTTLEVIAGVEINSEADWGDLHLLGYYLDPKNDFLRERLCTMRNARVDRARKMLVRLSDMGIRLKWEDVQNLVDGDSVGRPHIARALLEQGYVRTIQEAFNRFIDTDGPAYVPRLRLTPSEAIEAIVQAGGVAVLAHPAHSGASAVARIPEFAGYGLHGVEVYYPTHSSEDIEMLLELTQKHGMLATGGSDFHGPSATEGVSLGSVYVPAECVKSLREASGHSARQETSAPQYS